MDNFDILVQVKNEVIYRLIADSLAARQTLRSKEDQTEDIKEWMAMVDSMSRKLNHFAMVCHYCAEPFSPDTVNQKCLVNRSNVSEFFKGFCSENPTQEERGSG